MSAAECMNFSKKLAYHSAPTLLGIKCASLISLLVNEFEINYHISLFNSKAAVKGLKTRILCECNSRLLILVYNERLLCKRLEEKDISDLLTKCGYPQNASLNDYLEYLSERIKNCNEFPHEIGIFLGYPFEDVMGFIKNKGENFKLCGYWKVYGSEEKAKKMFSNYSKCRKFLCSRLNEGNDLYKTLKLS